MNNKPNQLVKRRMTSAFYTTDGIQFTDPVTDYHCSTSMFDKFGEIEVWKHESVWKLPPEDWPEDGYQKV